MRLSVLTVAATAGLIVIGSVHQGALAESCLQPSWRLRLAQAPKDPGQTGQERVGDAIQLESYPSLGNGSTGTIPFFLPHKRATTTVHYEAIDGLAIVEGDIILGSLSDLQRATRIRQDCAGPLCSAHSPRAILIKGESYRWPGCVIPYEIDPNFDSTMRAARIADMI